MHYILHYHLYRRLRRARPGALSDEAPVLLLLFLLLLLVLCLLVVLLLVLLLLLLLVVVVLVVATVLSLLLLLVVVVVVVLLIGLRRAPEFLDQGMFGMGDDTFGNPHRAQLYQFELFELILLNLDKQFPVEQFEASRAIRGSSISVSSTLSPLNTHTHTKNSSTNFRLCSLAKHIPFHRLALACGMDMNAAAQIMRIVMHNYQERLQPIADVYANVELTKQRELANYCGCLCRR